MVLLATALAGVGAGLSRADGDPASDVLYFQDVFLPYTAPSAGAAQQLKTTVAAANKAGFRIKVAVIQSAQDLGSVPSLFNRQDLYARFLGTELKTFYTQRLLVVMPAGFGIYDNGKPVDAEKSALAGVTIAGPDSDSLTNAATAAVQKLRSAIGTTRGKDIDRADGGGARLDGHERQADKAQLHRLRRERQGARDRPRLRPGTAPLRHDHDQAHEGEAEAEDVRHLEGAGRPFRDEASFLRARARRGREPEQDELRGAEDLVDR
jgi:hypothetical protein